VLQQQAHTFKSNIEAVVAGYIKEAIQSDRTTIYNALNDAGEPKLAELIRRL
jgi:DNA-binding phage protein